MKLEALREIAGKRTAGGWDVKVPAYQFDGCQILEKNGGVIFRSTDYAKMEDDAIFIKTAANTYDLLLDIAEAAEAVSKNKCLILAINETPRDTGCDRLLDIYERLDAALEGLRNHGRDRDIEG